MSDTLVNKYKTIIKYCEGKFLNNSTANQKIKISKEDFCNWIILIEIDSMDLSSDNLNIGIEEIYYYEAYEKYKNFIDEKISSYENYAKVYSLFNKVKKNQSISISEFVQKEKVILYNYFFEENLKDKDEISDDNRLDIYISQILSYAILKRKSVIDKIIKGANL